MMEYAFSPLPLPFRGLLVWIGCGFQNGLYHFMDWSFDFYAYFTDGYRSIDDYMLIMGSLRFWKVEKRNGTAIRSLRKPLNPYPRDMIPIGSISRTSHERWEKMVLSSCMYMNRGRNGTVPYSRLETVKIRLWEKFGSGSISHDGSSF